MRLIVYDCEDWLVVFKDLESGFGRKLVLRL